MYKEEGKSLSERVWDLEQGYKDLQKLNNTGSRLEGKHLYKYTSCSGDEEGFILAKGLKEAECRIPGKKEEYDLELVVEKEDILKLLEYGMVATYQLPF